jgi:signal transduction histidine kinase
MRERVLDWGGQFQIETRPGQGFKIEIDLPIKVHSDV